MERKNFNLYDFVDNLEKTFKTVENDDLIDIEKAQLYITTKLFHLNKIYRLYIGELTSIFTQSITNEDYFIKFIKRTDTFVELEKKLYEEYLKKQTGYG